MPVDNAFLGQLDPNLNSQLLTAQQQQAMARALMGQSMSPLQAPGGQNGRISPLSAIAQGLQAYMGSKMNKESTGKIADAEAGMGQNRLKLMGQMLGGGQTAGAPGAPPTPIGQDAPPVAPGAAPEPASVAPAQAGSVPIPMDDPNWRQMAMAEQLGMMPQGTADGYAKAKYGFASPTDQMKNDVWSGITPKQRAGITGGVNLSPDQSRVQVGQDGQPVLSMVAPNPDKNLQYGVNGGKVTATGVPGVPQAAAAMTGATSTAAANSAIRDVTLPNGQVVPVRAGAAADAGGAQAGLASGATWTGGKLSAVTLAKLERDAQAGDTNSRDVLTAYKAAQTPQLGQATGAKESVEGMSKKWEDLAANNGSSQQAISFLSNIKQLAGKAITGAASDKLAFANGLLAMTGVSEQAKDAQTATDLLNKNSNRITALLGQGSLGTDAARQVLAAANPNSKMSKQAISEAADDIIAQYKMNQVKTNVLLPFRNSNDAPGYNTAETKFNQVADPRVWRLQGMSEPEAAEYIKRMSPSDSAEFRKNRLEVIKNGWLQ